MILKIKLFHSRQLKPISVMLLVIVRLMAVRLTILLCLAGLAGCGHYSEPYQGYNDSQRNFWTEGFVSSMSPLGPLNESKVKPEKWADFPDNKPRPCVHSGQQTEDLEVLAETISDTMPQLKMNWTQEQFLAVHLPQAGIFYVNADHIRPDGYKSLDQLAAIVRQHTQEYPEMLFGFFGHTDSTGSEPTNYLLSSQRALHIQRYFVAQGVSADKTLRQPMGESQPLVDNSSQSHRTINRRVTLMACSTDSKVDK